jgi:diphthine-ammonia ligase
LAVSLRQVTSSLAVGSRRVLPVCRIQMANSTGLKFIALISGGKDSFFSILHCLKNGHECIALANLHPHDVRHDAQGHQIENENDTESYMYQTIGHSVVPLYEEALGIPLYRRPISGTAVDQSLTYTPGIAVSNRTDEGNSFDEAEDMFLLLKDVLSKHPNAQAVSTGAILSTYQRARVESVVVRLGLVPLSYLWQFPYLPPFRDKALLEDMAVVNQNSKIVKVASGGLDEKFLGLNVADDETTKKLKKIMSKYNPEVGAVLGEGGEYETLAMAGPLPLWKNQIVSTAHAIKAAGGGSYVLHLQGLSVRPYGNERRGDIRNLRMPPLIPTFRKAIATKVIEWVFQLKRNRATKRISQVESANGEVLESPKKLPERRYLSNTAYSDIGLRTAERVQYTTTEHGSSIRLSNIMADGTNAQEQMVNIVEFLKTRLLFLYDISPTAISFTTLLFRTMQDFTAVNKIYSNLFTESLPPARVAVAVGDSLPMDKYVSLSCTVNSGRGLQRKGLHVQSRSYWAPANIGPYSQAIIESIPVLPGIRSPPSAQTELVHLAGQIPLKPASMDMLQERDVEDIWNHLQSDSVFDRIEALKIDSSIISRAQICLALQHLMNVSKAIKVKLIELTAAVAIFSSRDASQAQDAEDLWNTLFEKAKITTTLTSTQLISSLLNSCLIVTKKIDSTEVEYIQKLTDLNNGELQGCSLLPKPHPLKTTASPCFSLFVSELPRGAPVEWWSLGLRGIVRSTFHLQHSTIYRSVSVASGVVVSWIAVEYAWTINFLAESAAEFAWTNASTDCHPSIESIGNGPLITLFTACTVDKCFMLRWRPTLIPCDRILHGQKELEALLLVEWKPSITSIQVAGCA